VDARLAESLEPFAYSFYRPAPDGALGLKDLMRFGMRGTGRDLWAIAALAVVLGLLGTITPYFSGQVLDTAVPQADRGLLVGFGFALVASAVASSLYKLAQDLSTIRVETRMTATIQAAVWDRILNLPVSFFRRYPAGDLADRASGVEAIQNLVAGAAVAAVLGSISGLFYAGQLFLYSLDLALVALGLTVVFVGVNTAGNYLQVRYQRDAMRTRGRIAGLTLNLLTGVAKLRIAGAELHAFRVWAEQFARQRRLSYSGGVLQNVTAVFNTGYPVVSSMVIFYTILAQQAHPGAARQAGLTIGEFFGFTTAFGLFLAAMQGLGDASVSLIQVLPIYERLQPVLTTPMEIDRSREVPGPLTGAIELSHLSFRYAPDSPWVVKDLSLTIAPGEFVAFVGPS
jgi:ATP-binding cassette subfamily C protein